MNRAKRTSGDTRSAKNVGWTKPEIKETEKKSRTAKSNELGYGEYKAAASERM